MSRRSYSHKTHLFEAANARPIFMDGASPGRTRSMERRRFLQGLAVLTGMSVGGLMFASRLSRGSTTLDEEQANLSELGFTTSSADPDAVTQEAMQIALEALEYNDPLSDAPFGDLVDEDEAPRLAFLEGAPSPLQRPASSASETPGSLLTPYPSTRIAQPSQAGPSPIPGSAAPEPSGGTTPSIDTRQQTATRSNSQVRPGTTPSRSLARYLTNAPRRLTVYNINTGERDTVIFANRGRYDSSGLDALDYLFRDRRTGDIAKIDAHLYDQLSAMQAILGVSEMGLISGYRSQRTNDALRSQSSGVARNSYHVRRQASDIRVAGVSAERIRAAAVQLGNGGVGYYGRSNFVHVDTGPVRAWAGN